MALRRAFSFLPAPERELRGQAGEGLIRSGELDPEGLLLACYGERVVGALLCLAMPGAAAMLWPPQADGEAGERAAIEDALIAYGTDWLRGQRTVLAQVLIAPNEATFAVPFLRHGFRVITRLRYLRHDLRNVVPPGITPGVEFVPFAQAPAVFGDVLLASYEAALDCPEIQGTRSREEILVGHGLARGHWWLVRFQEQAVGVLLVTPQGVEGWDLSYLGVVRAARRQGLGRLMVQHALASAAAAQAPQLTLAVDERNLPAIALYTALGFVPFDVREVYLAVWPRP